MLKKEISFADLGLKLPILNALMDLGYKNPYPIQIKCIPYLLSGCDVLGIAQTGSGKTAAFSLPLLHNINPNISIIQVLMLVPTRELAIQIKKACVNFAKYIKKVRIVALYGGQNYDIQIKSLKYGPQIVVSTPGRLLDHLRRKNLDLSNLDVLILDEADEMLRIGFIEDIKNILSQLPLKHQTALFSATMPKAIRHISYRFMNNPKEISINQNLDNKPKINQYYSIIKNIKKTEALLLFLEIERFDAVIIFVKTKIATFKITELLISKGYDNVAALNGDISQKQREQTVQSLKNGLLNILVATDVAARGLDIKHINLVINYDMPLNFESYIHRIGRTGRAGKSGKALLFVEKNERHLLRNIERLIKNNITEIKLPNADTLIKNRFEKLESYIKRELKNNRLNTYRSLLKKLKQTNNFNVENITIVLLKIVCDQVPLFLKVSKMREIYSLDNFLYKNRRLKKKNESKYTLDSSKIRET